MGGAKAWMMEQEYRGYKEVEGNVCADCFSHPIIKDHITETAVSDTCAYCGQKSHENIAAPLDDVMEIIMGGITFEWNSPDGESVAYETKEGGYQANLTDTYDLVYDHYELSENVKVLDAILSSIQNGQWVPKDFYIGSEDLRYKWAWEEFCSEIIHKKRFIFLHRDGDRGFSPEIAPADFLFELADYKNKKLDEVDLIREIETTKQIFRVRVDKESHSTAKALGAPVSEYALRANRMSPAGIPMFYGAFDKKTAISETYDPKLAKEGEVLSLGKFQPLRKLKCLDLATLPKIPSVFELERQHLIHPLSFFHSFAVDIAKPVERNGREHIEYVPTQVVTEFFRHIYETSAGEKLDGIIYRSSKNDERDACVLFCENHQACGHEEVGNGCLLEMVGVEHIFTDKEKL